MYCCPYEPDLSASLLKRLSNYCSQGHDNVGRLIVSVRTYMCCHPYRYGEQWPPFPPTPTPVLVFGCTFLSLTHRHNLSHLNVHLPWKSQVDKLLILSIKKLILSVDMKDHPQNVIRTRTLYFPHLNISDRHSHGQSECPKRRCWYNVLHIDHGVSVMAWVM